MSRYLPRQLARDERGFTLIEVLVAGLVIVIGMIALAGVLIGAQNQASADVQQNQLINVADQQIEQVRGAVGTQGFLALGMSAVPSAQSTAKVRSTWFDPQNFVEGGCFEIANNYDAVNVAANAAAPYGTAPTGFTPWSSCNAQSEPLQTLTSGAIVQEAGTSVGQCTGSGGTGTAIASPCWTKLNSSCTATGTYVITGVPACAVTVYTFVTDTYVGCGGATSTTGTTTSAAQLCPDASSGTVQDGTAQALSSCMTTSSSASQPCADARRVTVAVVPNVVHTNAQVTPLYLSSVFTNPQPSNDSGGSIGITAGVSL
jgi:type II secretory pathway pseudopilin PulG